MSRVTIERLYAAFERLDGDAMAACYAETARFDDAVFALQGRREVGAMWRMLCDAVRADPGGGWRLEVSAIGDASAHWEAHYRFSATGRRVHNVIDAEFDFDGEGLILRHRDRFGFWRWARQALGLPGLLLGWTPWLRHKVRTQAARRLQRQLGAAAP